MAPNSGEPDAAALRDRVDALEQTVSEQQATIEALQEPTPSRRGVLAALTGVAGAGALGAYSQRASAQAAGQVGTQSEPVDVEAYDLNVQGTANGLVQNPLTGDLDAGENSLTNVEAVGATQTTTEDPSSTGIDFRTEIASTVSNTGQTEFTFTSDTATSLDDYDWLDFYLQLDTTNPFTYQARVAGDGASTGSYDYRDIWKGTTTLDANQWEIADVNSREFRVRISMSPSHASYFCWGGNANFSQYSANLGFYQDGAMGDSLKIFSDDGSSPFGLDGVAIGHMWGN